MFGHLSLRVFQGGNRRLQDGACVENGGYPAPQFAPVHLGPEMFSGSGNRKAVHHHGR